MKATSKDHLDLLAMIVPHIGEIGENECKWYLRNENRSQISEALRRGFVIATPQVEIAPVELKVTPPPPRPSFPLADTNLSEALKEAEDFAKKFFGTRPNLHRQFTMPERLPWKEVIAVYDPGTLTNREVVDKVLKTQKKISDVYEEADVMRYSGSEATGKPTLRFIERSETPTKDTMGLSADEIVATKRTFLGLRGYAIAFGLYHNLTKLFLDSQTWTRFPHNRLPSGEVACGGWRPDCSRVVFYWGYPGARCSSAGGREAVECSLATP